MHRHFRPSWNELPSEQWTEAERFYEDLMGGPGIATRGLGPESEFDIESFDDEAMPPRQTKLPAGVRLGLWVDDATVIFKRSEVSNTLQRMQELSIDEICVKVSGDPDHLDRLDIVPNVERLITNFNNAASRARADIDLSIYAWITPRERRCRQLVQVLPSLAARVGAKAVEYDVEAPWYDRRASRGTTHDHLALTYLHLQMSNQLLAEMGRDAASIGVNFVPNGLNAATGHSLMRGADFFVPQMYSELSNSKLIEPLRRAVALGDKARAKALRAEIGKRKVGEWAGPYAYPKRLWEKFRGRFPDLPIERSYPGVRKSVIVGLANFGRGNWGLPEADPGTTVADVMAMDMAVVHELHARFQIGGVRYWSSKQLRRTGTDVYAFTRGLK